MKKVKYSDTIRQKCEKKNEIPAQDKKPLFSLNRINALLWPLFLSPLFTVLYAPVNRRITLPKLE